VKPTHPIGRTWWVRVPGFVVAVAAINRAHWLTDHPSQNVQGASWRLWFVVLFAAVGAINLGWHLSAPWRTRTGAPWVAFITFAAWMSYATVIAADIGWQQVRGTALDLMALAVLIAWSWGADRERIDDA
jgi:hypothetical protein